MTKLKIDPEFKSIIPPLSAIEFEGLEKQILADGCLDALKVWDQNGELIILDGHNRYVICGEHKIEFQTDTIELESREHAINWIIDHQLGRRNLSEQQKSNLRGKRYETEKKIEGRPIAGKPVQSEQVKPMETAQRLAKQYGVGRSTIQRDEQYSKSIDKIKEVNPELAQKVLLGPERGGIAIPKVEIRELGKLTEPELKQVIDAGISAIKDHSEQRIVAEKMKTERERIAEEAREFDRFNKPVAKKIAESNAKFDRIIKATGGGCLMPNVAELWCIDCKWGFDVYLPTPYTPNCPYCKGPNVEKRNAEWNSRDVI